MKFLKFLETKGISAEQFKELPAEKQADLQNEYLGTLETKLESTVSRDDLVKEIAKAKEPDLTASDLDAAVNTIAGSARSMGLVVEG